ncbi:glycosyl hydrolase family 114 [Roseivirga pacifica]|uniref:Glycoside-hydrolase family GH114 n=1 Tax=Roseivirga pacifica TaxID=1267423 RepID=A0A1I0RHN1_9BACT|nr:endo alpha-1,4 polygalactosaminidase [Roseivirga pacifica]RKQ49640.1 glycosyl hydrolase family 114 [Roseivirga pacifica]SEW40346.1 Glycoside-hydrolase family GH114 [Roseivirga pacifica]
MRPIKHIASLLALFSFTGLSCQESINSTVLVCYGKINPDSVRNYKYVILESEQFNSFDVGLMKESNELLLGYISLGEVSANRNYFDLLKERTLGKNEIWDSYYLNLRDSTTKRTLLGLVEKIREKGFDGLFLDTVDAFGPWGPSSNQANDYVSLLKEITEQFPGIHLMQNSGIALLPKSAPYVSSLALESVVTDYDFGKSAYRLRKTSGFNERVKELTEVDEQYDLSIVMIEYANTKKMANRVKNQALNLPWDYFIGKIDLAEIPKY